jgi:hypothetical protein
MGEIDIPLMGRHIGALGHEAKVTEIALLHHRGIVRSGNAIGLHGGGVVDEIEKDREGLAKTDATAAVVTNLENPVHLLLQRPGVVKIRGSPVDGVTERGFAITGDGRFRCHKCSLGQQRRKPRCGSPETRRKD